MDLCGAARKGDHDFLAYTGPELLGVVTLWEISARNGTSKTPDVYGRAS